MYAFSSPHAITDSPGITLQAATVQAPDVTGITISNHPILGKSIRTVEFVYVYIRTLLILYNSQLEYLLSLHGVSSLNYHYPTRNVMHVTCMFLHFTCMFNVT